MEKKHLDCPFIKVQQILNSKWSIIILNYISNAPIRFNELHRLLSPISQATLSKQLKQLEETGLITRKVYPQIPPKVEYELSDIGKEFNLVLNQIEIFGLKYINYLKNI